MTLDSPPSAGGDMDDQRIYIPLQGGQVIALERQTGVMVWQRALEAGWPLVVRDGVVFAAAGAEIHAIAAETGEPVWDVRLERPVMGPLGIQGSLLIALMSPDDVFAYRIGDGQVVWRHSLGGTAGTTQMTVGTDAVYVTAPGGRLVALSLTNGHPQWETKLPGTLSPPAAAHDRVFVGSSDNFFYAFSGRTGHLEWKWRSGGDVVGAAADKDAVYFVSLDNILRAVNRGNGNQRWQKDTGTRPVGPPHVVGPAVVVSGVGVALSAFSVMNGAPLGTYSPPGAAELKLEGDPMLDPELLPFEVAGAILTRDGRLIALRPTGMMFREAPAAPFVQLPGRHLDREPPPFVPVEDPSIP